MRTRAALTLALLACPLAARAQDRGVAFAGGQTDHSRAAYYGVELALPGAALGHGLAVRGSAFVGDYAYEADTLGRVKADFRGAEVDGVYQWSGGWGWATAGVGLRYVETELGPRDPGNRRHGRQGELAFSTDGSRLMGPWRVDWYGSYGTRLSDFQGRVSLTRQAGPVFRVGVEAAGEADPTYDQERIGPFAALRLGPRSEVQGSAGVSRQSGRDAAAYARISIYRSF